MTFDRRFKVPLDFDFFKYAVYPYGTENFFFERHKLKFFEKVNFV